MGIGLMMKLINSWCYYFNPGTNSQVYPTFTVIPLNNNQIAHGHRFNDEID